MWYSDNDSDRLQENSDVGRTDKSEGAANGGCNCFWIIVNNNNNYLR